MRRIIKTFSRPSTESYQQIKERAEQMISNAKTDKEKRAIQERLDAVRLRYTYGF